MLKRDGKTLRICLQGEETDNQRVGNNETCTVYTPIKREGLGWNKRESAMCLRAPQLKIAGTKRRGRPLWLESKTGCVVPKVWLLRLSLSIYRLVEREYAEHIPLREKNNAGRESKKGKDPPSLHWVSQAPSRKGGNDVDNRFLPAK